VALFLLAGFPSCQPTNSDETLKKCQSIDSSQWPGLSIYHQTLKGRKRHCFLYVAFPG